MAERPNLLVVAGIVRVDGTADERVATTISILSTAGTRTKRGFGVESRTLRSHPSISIRREVSPRLWVFESNRH